MRLTLSLVCLGADVCLQITESFCLLTKYWINSLILSWIILQHDKSLTDWLRNAVDADSLCRVNRGPWEEAKNSWAKEMSLFFTFILHEHFIFIVINISRPSITSHLLYVSGDSFCVIDWYSLDERHFMRRFWNHTFTCSSVRPNDSANCVRGPFWMYWLSANAFSRLIRCFSVKTARKKRRHFVFSDLEFFSSWFNKSLSFSILAVSNLRVSAFDRWAFFLLQGAMCDELITFSLWSAVLRCMERLQLLCLPGSADESEDEETGGWISKSW